MCRVVEDTKPEVVSFHFGLPDSALLARVKAAGCRVMASATTVTEALWLEARGVDLIIAQGYEAGGHRGMFLTPNLNRASASQPGKGVFLGICAQGHLNPMKGARPPVSIARS